MNENDTVMLFEGRSSLMELVDPVSATVALCALTGGGATIGVDHPDVRDALQQLVDSVVAEGILEEGQVTIELMV